VGKSAHRSNQNYHRVGGWLALFCFTLLVFTPIIALRLLGFLFALVVYERSVRALWSEAAFDAAGGVALIVFGLVVSVQLLRIKPNAVKLTMTYLVSYAGYAVFAAVAAPLLFGHAWRMSQLRDAGLAAVLAAVWATYFKRSKRVAATYRTLPLEPSIGPRQPTSGSSEGGTYVGTAR
jgi:Protein of unknown function (DUF2569)